MIIRDLFCDFNCNDCKILKATTDGDIVIPDKKIVTIQTTTICNARCKCCVHRFLSDKNKVMSDDVWSKIVSDISKLKTKPYIQFGALDEPLCDLKLEERISDLKSVGVNDVVIITNASLLTKERVNSLIDSGLTRFCMSQLSPIRKEFNIITGLDYDTVLSNILNCADICEERGIDYIIAPCVLNKNRIKFVEKLFHGRKYNITFHENRTNEGRWMGSQPMFSNCACLVGPIKLFITHNGFVDFCKSKSRDVRYNSIGDIFNIFNECELNCKKCEITNEAN